MAKKKQTNTPQIETRDPVVAIMGHIDHGKSTLLDFVRQSKVAQGEVGGITQHISAYEAEHNGRKITFLDTPGHAAFSATRERGAAIADIAILVIAADDGVQDQTLSAYQFIKDSGIPFVVAINKIDKNNADVERTLNSMLEHSIFVEGRGGDVPYTAISAQTGEGIGELLDTVLLTADLEELSGDRNIRASGYILESSLDAKKGIQATCIIKNGSMRNGQVVLAGRAMAPVRIMEDFTGTSIQEASFSKPVRIIGFDTLPEPGLDFNVFENKKEAQKFLNELDELSEEQEIEISDTDIGGKVAIPLVIKADVQGSIDAIKYQVASITSQTAYFKIIDDGVGEISEADVKKAGADSQAVFVGFNVGISKSAQDSIQIHNMTAKSFDIIYELSEYLENILETRRPRVRVEQITGTVRIVRIFSWSNKGGVVGGRVSEGAIALGDKMKIIRRGHQVGTAIIRELQRGKQEARQVEAPDEFGMRIDTKFEIAEGDDMQSITIVEE
ncbi:MAG: translation initiation factor IF-2 [Patescibacteria group bacterium]